MFFSSILVDFGLHFGTPAVRDSLVWATMAALGSCLALSWVILRALIRFLPPLGSIFDRFLIESGLHFLILGTIFQWFWESFVVGSSFLLSFLISVFFCVTMLGASVDLFFVCFRRLVFHVFCHILFYFSFLLFVSFVVRLGSFR